MSTQQPNPQPDGQVNPQGPLEAEQLVIHRQPERARTGAPQRPGDRGNQQQQPADAQMGNLLKDLLIDLGILVVQNTWWGLLLFVAPAIVLYSFDYTAHFLTDPMTFRVLVTIFAYLAWIPLLGGVVVQGHKNVFTIALSVLSFLAALLVVILIPPTPTSPVPALVIILLGLSQIAPFFISGLKEQGKYELPSLAGAFLGLLAIVIMLGGNLPQ